MLLAHPKESGFDRPDAVDRRRAPEPHPVAHTILLGLLATAAALSLYALATARLGLVPAMAPVAYVCLAVVAVMLLINCAVTLLRSEMHAGLALLSFWALVFCGAFVGLQLLR